MATSIARQSGKKTQRKRTRHQLSEGPAKLAADVEGALDERFDEFMARLLHDPDCLFDDVVLAFELAKLVAMARQLRVSLEKVARGIPTIRRTTRG